MTKYTSLFITKRHPVTYRRSGAPLMLVCTIHDNYVRMFIILLSRCAIWYNTRIVIYATIKLINITYPQYIHLICFFVKTFQYYPAHLFFNIFAFWLFEYYNMFFYIVWNHYIIEQKTNINKGEERGKRALFIYRTLCHSREHQYNLESVRDFLNIPVSDPYLQSAPLPPYQLII